MKNKIVSTDEWLTARKDFLKKEKEFTKLRDELTLERRKLPWLRIDKDYEFDGPAGKESLGHLFGDHSQLIIYHFMYGPEWPEGCKACSLLADQYEPLVIHLRYRDVSLVTVSRAPLKTLEAYKQRMNWSFKWVSSLENDFNRDFNVSFDQADVDAGRVTYNYESGVTFPSTEAPGISSFYKDEKGEVFLTYSAFARGLESFIGIYHFLDIVPKGRDESGLSYTMEWIRHKDRYDDREL